MISFSNSRGRTVKSDLLSRNQFVLHTDAAVVDEISTLTIRLLAAKERLIGGAGLSFSSPSGTLSSFSLDEQLQRFVVDGWKELSEERHGIPLVDNI